MEKKSLVLIVFAAVLAVIYVIFFTTWFRPETVRIFHTTRYVSRRGAANDPKPELMFGLSQRLKLTEIEVVSLATNQNVLPLWHLVSTSNSVPVKSFAYGQFIRGLHPALPGDRAEPLATNVPYRLTVRAGRITGQHDFELK